jgi:hypothetical protein
VLEVVEDAGRNQAAAPGDDLADLGDAGALGGDR